MDVALFGALSVVDGHRKLRGNDFGGAKPRGLLELLLLARGRTVSKDALAEALWGTSPPNNAMGALEHYVCLLRNRVFDDRARSRRVIVTEPNAYRFDFDNVRLDVSTFDQLMIEAEHADVARRRSLLRDAVAIAQGDLLEDAPYAPWAEPERHLYRDRIARANLWLAQDRVAVGDFPAAVRRAEDALRFAPFSEQAYRLIMVADYALGHDDLARKTFARCRQTLDEGIDVDPTTETAEVAAAIAAGAPVSELVAAVTAPAQPELRPRSRPPHPVVRRVRFPASHRPQTRTSVRSTSVSRSASLPAAMSSSAAC